MLHLRNSCVLYNDADGQKIAKRLSKQISKETTLLKSLLREYNAVCTTSLKSDDTLTMPSALDPESIEGRLSALGTKYTSIATGNKRRILDAYSILSRSREELVMLKQESQMLVQYYEQRKQRVIAQLSNLSDESTTFSRGAVTMLKGLVERTGLYLEQGHHVVAAMDNSDNTVSYETDSDSSNFSEQSDDSDCNDDILD